EGRGSADHAAADVGGKTAPGSTQVEWKDLREVFAEIAELRDRQKSCRCDAKLEQPGLITEQVEVSERKDDQTGHEEHPEQRSPPDRGQEQHRQYNPPGQPARFLPQLRVLTSRLDRCIK